MGRWSSSSNVQVGGGKLKELHIVCDQSGHEGPPPDYIRSVLFHNASIQNLRFVGWKRVWDCPTFLRPDQETASAAEPADAGNSVTNPLEQITEQRMSAKSPPLPLPVLVPALQRLELE